MTFVIDHLAKPEGYGFSYEAWFEDLKEASKYPNVFCKLSGYVPQRIEDWSVEAFEPFIKVNLIQFNDFRFFFQFSKNNL
jgi:L-fuconolactonase